MDEMPCQSGRYICKKELTAICGQLFLLICISQVCDALKFPTFMCFSCMDAFALTLYPHNDIMT